MIIGVELGYERSRVGIWRRDSSADGEHVAIYTTRSIVGFTAHACLVGDAAGALEEIPVVRHVASRASARALEKTWTAEQLLALLLGHLKRRAEDFLEDTVTGVVMGVPADFDAFHVAAVDAAARMAGVEMRRCRPALTYAGLPCSRALLSREAQNVLICGDDAVYIVRVEHGIAEGLHFVRFDAEASVEQRIHAVEAAHRACGEELHLVLASEAMRRDSALFCVPDIVCVLSHLPSHPLVRVVSYRFFELLPRLDDFVIALSCVGHISAVHADSVFPIECFEYHPPYSCSDYVDLLFWFNFFEFVGVPYDGNAGAIPLKIPSPYHCSSLAIASLGVVARVRCRGIARLCTLNFWRLTDAVARTPSF
ncbi:hypothetical protein EMIHUDRAFT_221115 [Emiliania huxleyi CCMP1516]|uniref:Uncharacterized protein n=2 Tax=Emiliania huxleyi TaxID=2903 RepID=A0A0D3HZA6_EMIH1|nr:hypothetical protein EMIHUDRAFT_221115 [Emiliania huxleyi CCMP1516]EOD04341.1 hypothetical protein EMIHUDRAFT_221115 [Emiliania huxleyi CCMP1516]|eukprot:XP_005756770.1 hypothetical protein EMIHUDRAFT_221115 [Emiliania huxleyi CCMP1516]